MASCPVPNFPAVMVTLEHLEELDKQLREEGVPFAPKASLHLTEITAAITELEADRRVAHEHLEVETIENSKLRHQINSMRERMTEEIMADVTAARASNAEEIETLRKELNAASQLKEDSLRKQQELLNQNKALQPEREQVKAEYEAVVATLNDQITLKYSLQMQLDQTKEQTEEIKSCIAAVERDKIALEQSMTPEREAYSVNKHNLSREVDQAEEMIKQQKQVNKRRRRELDQVNGKKQEAHDHLNEVTIQVAKLDNNVQRLTTSMCQCEKQLEGETQKHQELRQQRETLKKELREMGEAFTLAIQHLQEEITSVEGKIEEDRAARLLCQDALAQICEVFKYRHRKETEVRAEYLHVSQQLERSKLQLEERIASIVKHGMEIKDMEKLIGELLESDKINKRLFERNQEELCENMDTEKKNISHLEEERKQLSRHLEEAKRKQEEYVVKMKSDTSNSRRRYRELQQEEAALQLRQPKSSSDGLLMSHINQSEVEYRQIESMHRQEIQQCTAEVESITKSNKEKQKEVEEKEEMLKEVEAEWNEEQSRHKRLKALTFELKRKKTELETLVRRLEEKTSSLLQPKEELKAELKERREQYIDMLDTQASELRAVEVSIYDSSVKLEEVNMENSRLQLSIRQMIEELSRARQDKHRYQRKAQQFKQDTEALIESLQEAWREDLWVTQESQRRNGDLLVSLSSLLNHLETRRQDLEHVNTRTHQCMLDFSKRLGDKTTVQHS
ncbi:myosin heavy chain, embryonic smooth muscle isoform [Stegastes partitus]|uniref:Myosin heavy chain, embryonic smooth muscle isoform n=1 Tax=Stegastes partitus TaxID=144197 RepID=A0A9Y4KD41_9TELE|nr:PREDICTED: myosin heavy chain, embryonic smooth muscle isoform-like [Stegastes partitus]